tara:strand:+ start:10899 stop:11564 length:666 start_codon:yes stop_codon:yes gene_type:complete
MNIIFYGAEEEIKSKIIREIELSNNVKNFNDFMDLIDFVRVNLVDIFIVDLSDSMFKGLIDTVRDLSDNRLYILGYNQTKARHRDLGIFRVVDENNVNEIIRWVKEDRKILLKEEPNNLKNFLGDPLMFTEAVDLLISSKQEILDKINEEKSNLNDQKASINQLRGLVSVFGEKDFINYLKDIENKISSVRRVLQSEEKLYITKRVNELEKVLKIKRESIY